VANIGMLICFRLVELVSFILVFVCTIVITFVVIDGRCMTKDVLIPCQERLKRKLSHNKRDCKTIFLVIFIIFLDQFD
jgi:hypothetical protein